MGGNLLDYKRILIVDDEPDVLDALEELLPTSEVVRASSFSEAKTLLDREYFDLAILDIMGVDGYALLEIARAKNKDVIPVMLTAHALSPEDARKSFEEGAASYIPKERLSDISLYLNDILEAKQKGKSSWSRWFERFGSYMDRKFGPDWKKDDRQFWSRFGYWE
jgi:DNA-binding NtrC family response regulator